MQQVLEHMLPQAEELAAADQAQLDAAMRRLEAAKAELAAAQDTVDLTSGMVRSSSTLLATIKEQLQRQHTATEPARDLSATVAESTATTRGRPAQLTVAGAIRALLQERGEATYGEITAYIQQVRPDVKIKNTSPELSRMVKRGELVRPRVGSYQLSSDSRAADSF
ncbi:hypothetical protein [Streptomyces sp. NPDC052012]|uniref:hypothetical protein n=1 Tax=Streptomyces sp. NPDC052012 TaxID=3155051 RepID=UPI00344B443F